MESRNCGLFCIIPWKLMMISTVILNWLVQFSPNNFQENDKVILTKLDIKN